jgi:deoxyadenosine/deoxycytidine kinase
MGKLIIVTGNSGVGKTTLVRALSETGKYTTGLEGHLERPFQALFKNNPRYALANQLDYLLLRAEQEQAIRSGSQTGILDGGLEMDFFIFSRLFRQKGWLTAEEFELLERLVRSLRNYLPPPDVIIYMHAPPDIVANRFRRRGRPLEIATPADIQATGVLLEEWLVKTSPDRLISFDASEDDPSYQLALPSLLEKISIMLGDHPS